MFGIESHFNLPESDLPDWNLLNCAHIHEQQQQDGKLLALQVKYPENCVSMDMEDEFNDIICYKKGPIKDGWKIALPA